MKPIACLALAPLFLTACQKPIKVGPPPPPAEHMVCEALPEKPAVEPLQAFSIEGGMQVYRRADVDARDGEIASYVIDLRGAWFDCHSELGWIRDYYEGQ